MIYQEGDVTFLGIAYCTVGYQHGILRWCFLAATISQSILLSHGNRSGSYPGKNRGLERGVSCVVVVPRRRYSAIELVLANMNARMRRRIFIMLRCLISKLTSNNTLPQRMMTESAIGGACVLGSSNGSRESTKEDLTLRSCLPGNRQFSNLINTRGWERKCFSFLRNSHYLMSTAIES